MAAGGVDVEAVAAHVVLFFFFLFFFFFGLVCWRWWVGLEVLLTCLQIEVRW